jgi:hypothetical protein
VSPGAGVGTGFGSSVAVSRGTIVVGAPFHANMAGQAFVFQEGAGGWHQVAELVGSGVVGADLFGASVAVSGPTVVVGARGFNASNVGRVYIFQEGTGGWHEVARLVGSGAAVGTAFGYSVAVSGGTAVVGALSAFRAFIFQEGAGGWHQVADLVGSVGVGTDLFGQSVAVSGPTVVVGELNDGQAYVFHG